MRGLEYSETNKAEAKHQLGAMQNIIDYQLQSASAVGRRRFAKPISIEKTTQKIIDSLNKLHSAKSIEAELRIDDDTVFYGDQGD